VRRTWRPIAALLAPLAICAACSSTAPSSAQDGSSEITIPSCFFGTTWNPMEGAQLFTTTSQAVYDPLIMVTAEGVDPQPWLAE
jgi:ABC-type transport system substrate-binding protein